MGIGVVGVDYMFVGDVVEFCEYFLFVGWQLFDVFCVVVVDDFYVEFVGVDCQCLGDVGWIGVIVVWCMKCVQNVVEIVIGVQFVNMVWVDYFYWKLECVVDIYCMVQLVYFVFGVGKVK